MESYLFIVYVTTLPVGEAVATASNDKLVEGSGRGFSCWRRRGKPLKTPGYAVSWVDILNGYLPNSSQKRCYVTLNITNLIFHT
jgi:hypothetical protein